MNVLTKCVPARDGIQIEERLTEREREREGRDDVDVDGRGDGERMRRTQNPA